MKFAHLSDCHIGGWREPELKKLNFLSFQKAIEDSLQEQVDFILLAGDLFDTALPHIDYIKETTKLLRKVKDGGVPVYIIPGSHDFSYSGKTMLDVLEHAGLVTNVMRFDHEKRLQFFIDPKTGVKLTGMYGKKGGLEVYDYEKLDCSFLEREEGKKIFMFHTGLEEFKPADMEKVSLQSVAMLPKNFDYYAGGHIHYRFITSYDRGKIVYPGPTFPNNFKELEDLECGSYVLVTDFVPIVKKLPLKEVICISLDVTGLSAQQASEAVSQRFFGKDIKDKILLLRIYGELAFGKPSDITYPEFSETTLFLKHTAKLQAKIFEEMEVSSQENVEAIEQEVINQHLGQLPLPQESEIINHLLTTLEGEKMEGEKVADFEARILSALLKQIQL